MNLSPRNKLIALGAGLVVLVIVLVVVLVVPQFGKLAELDSQIDQANDESTAARTLLEQRREVKNKAAVTSNSLLQLANAVPENPELPSLIIELQDTAYASGVSMQSVVPEIPEQGEDEEFVSVRMVVQVFGTWSDTVDFLQRLNKLGREVRVQHFSAMVLDPAIADDAGLEVPPYYQVATQVTVVSYVIPAGSVAASESAVPAPAPAPAE